MKIGEVKWFGAQNANNVVYGFITELDGEESVYFNEHGIDPSSKFVVLKRNGRYDDREGEYVVYDRRQAPNGKLSARRVRLLEELDQEALKRLFQECCAGRRGAELEILAKIASSLFDEQPPAFFIPYLDWEHLREIFVSRCEKLEPAGLKEALEGHLEEKPVRDVLAKKYPELFFDKDPAVYFPYLDYYPAKVTKLFTERYQQGYFPTPVAGLYKDWLEKEFYVSSYVINDVLSALDLEREPLEDLVSLMVLAREKGCSISSILLRKPEPLWTRPEICACAAAADIKDLPLEDILRQDETLMFLARHTQDEAWQHIVGHLTGKQLLRCERSARALTSDQAVSIVSELDWADTSGENLALYQPFLSALDMDRYPDAVMAAAVSLREKGAAFSLPWWKLLTDSMKVRLLIYLSNFKEERQAWFTPVRDVFLWEKEQENLLMQAVLQFFVTIYAENAATRRERFLEAHSLLMNYIVDCFTAGINVTPGLSSLLENCARHRPRASASQYFCEARIWHTRNPEEPVKIWCPTGSTVCSDFPGADLTITSFRYAQMQGAAVREADYQTQYFMDFLLNTGGIPDLSSIDVEDRTEYPFRISAYVNILLRMRGHMKCSFCGERFHPKFKYATLKTAKLSVNRFYCLKAGSGRELHDKDVYLNFCYRCHEHIIDSRECRIRDSSGQYLCMHCGGAQNTERGTVCPNCGCDDREMLSMRGRSQISCKKCGYDAKSFESVFEN